ncbi:MAG TPA: hypothetical protein VFG39_02990 [Balneolaceae bacterium]|nr:hypothetical protein [Balneolaceae bacterium]
MTKIFSSHFSIIFLAGVLLAGCSKSDDQRDFENGAFAVPRGITEMTANGTVVPDKEDPEDWRIAPMYRGLIDIETPAYPNPVALNSSFRIDLYITGLETISALKVYAFELPGKLYVPIYVRENLSSTSLVTINLNAAAVANSSAGSQAAGLYRILIYDGRQNLISYGDVRIQ